MDRTDMRILRVLQKRARISIVDLAKQVDLTKTPCTERVRRLEQAGIIVGYHAQLDPVALGCDHVVMVQVLMKSTNAQDLARFNEAVKGIPEIQSCHMIAGDFDYLLKIRTTDIKAYRTLLGEAISELPGVKQTHTYVVLESVKDETTFPFEHQP